MFRKRVLPPTAGKREIKDFPKLPIGELPLLPLKLELQAYCKKENERGSEDGKYFADLGGPMFTPLALIHRKKLRWLNKF